MCDLAAMAVGAALQRYVLDRRLFLINNSISIIKVEIVGVQIKPEFLRPFVLCYCDPSTPTELIDKKDQDFYANTRHKILRITTSKGFRFALDLARKQYAFPGYDHIMDYDLYIQHFVNEILLEQDPIEAMNNARCDVQTAIAHMGSNRNAQDIEMLETTKSILHGGTKIQDVFKRLADFKTNVEVTDLTNDVLKSDCLTHGWW